MEVLYERESALVADIVVSFIIIYVYIC
jgi:hypothetical protein